MPGRFIKPENSAMEDSMTKKVNAAANSRKGGKASKGKLYAAILAGGVGSRFWPLSRETTPKQLLKVVGDESLLRATIRRLHPLVPAERALIVTSAKQAELIRLHLMYDGKAMNPGYVIEPEGKNTAPAIGLAAVELYRKDPGAVMAVLPSDHIIEDSGAFRRALRAGHMAALDGHLVTFGIKPTSPATGFGYIKAGAGRLKKIDGFEVRKVGSFVEKPDIKKARAYLKAGGYFWNSGILLCRVDRILEEFKAHMPGLYGELAGVLDGKDVAGAYERAEAVSIDYGILEKADDVVVIPASFPWSDMGTWSSFSDAVRPDGQGNIIRGRVVDIGSKDSIIFGCDRAVATIGLDNVILVDTPDATLVCPKERAQEVKEVVGLLKKKGYTEHEYHRTVERPWGSYTLLEKGNGYKIKKICVGPRRRLSLQAHGRRSEHWVVIAGMARVQRGEETVDVAVNQSTYIPRGVKHRLENPLDEMLEIIEVQTGGYVEEDDIVRFDDDFERR